MHMFVGFIRLSAYSKSCFHQYHCLCIYEQIQRGDRRSGPPPPRPRKITGYMGFYRNKYLTPPPPLEEADPPHTLENVGPPLDPWKSIVFSVIKPLDPLLYIWVRILKTTM